MRKFKASGSTGLADALQNALAAKQAAAFKPYRIEGAKPVVIPPSAPRPLAEKRKREEQGNKIKKHCAVIKRTEPRLLMELLQNFGTIEGLNAVKQAELIKRLEGIRKEYRI